MLKCNKLHLVISKEKLRMKYARSKSYWMSREILLLCLIEISRRFNFKNVCFLSTSYSFYLIQ